MHDATRVEITEAGSSRRLLQMVPPMVQDQAASGLILVIFDGYRLWVI